MYDVFQPWFSIHISNAWNNRHIQCIPSSHEISPDNSYCKEYETWDVRHVNDKGIMDDNVVTSPINIQPREFLKWKENCFIYIYIKSCTLKHRSKWSKVESSVGSDGDSMYLQMKLLSIEMIQKCSIDFQKMVIWLQYVCMYVYSLASISAESHIEHIN